MTRRGFLIVALLLSGSVALVTQMLSVGQRDASLLETLGRTGVSNHGGESVISVRPANCDNRAVGAEPILLVADISARVSSTHEGYLEFGEKEQGVFIDFDPWDLGLLRLSVVTGDGGIVQTRLRTLRSVSDEPVAIFVLGNTVEWWSREGHSRITNARPLGCTTLTLGAVNGATSISGSVSARLEFGDEAVALRRQVDDHFQQLFSRDWLSLLSLIAQTTFVAVLMAAGWNRFRQRVDRNPPL